MDHEQLKALVKEMRSAQKKYFRDRSHEALQRSKALERRADEEIAAAERQELANDPDVILMANGQKLVQGNLFEDK